VSSVAAGASLTAVWVLLWLVAFARWTPTGGSALTGAGFAWVTLAASTIAGVVAVLLARYGDRGAAVGVAAVAGTAAGVTGLAVELYLLLTGGWILWLHRAQAAGIPQLIL
jgi:hypothetical protein